MTVDAVPIWLQLLGAIGAVIGAAFIVFGRLMGFVNAHFRAWNVKYVISPVPSLSEDRGFSWRYRTNQLGKHVICLRISPSTHVQLDEIEVRFTNRRRYLRWKWGPAPRDKVEVLWIADVDYYRTYGTREQVPFSMQNQRPDTVGGKRANYVHRECNKDSYVWIYVVVDLKQEWAGRLHFRADLYNGNRYARQTFAVTLANNSTVRCMLNYLAYGPIRKSVHPINWLDEHGDYQIVKVSATKQLS